MSNQLIIKKEIENLQNKIKVITQTVNEFSALSESELDQINPIANILLNRRISNRELLEVYTLELEKEKDNYTWLVSQSKSMTS